MQLDISPLTSTLTPALLSERERERAALKARAERVEQGLAIARQRNTSQKNELVFERVETLLAFVRGGMSFEEAARRVNISPSVLDQLEGLVTSSLSERAFERDGGKGKGKRAKGLTSSFPLPPPPFPNLSNKFTASGDEP